MKAVRMLKTQKGFSLIELMIVVAIIGILATVAIPNFTKFQAKARASESRAQLAALFTAEKAFNAEFNSHLSDLFNLGYRPNGTLRYVVGFAAGFTPPVAVYPGTYVAANTTTVTTCPLGQCVNGATDPAGVVLTAAVIPAAALVTATTFIGAAAGFVGGTATDIWQIDEAKAVSNPTPGGY